MALDHTQLREPVIRDDILDQEEMIEATVEVQKMLIERTRFQYQTDTWVSEELMQIYYLLHQASSRLSSLRATGAFPE